MFFFCRVVQVGTLLDTTLCQRIRLGFCFLRRVQTCSRFVVLLNVWHLEAFCDLVSFSEQSVCSTCSDAQTRRICACVHEDHHVRTFQSTRVRCVARIATTMILFTTPHGNIFNQCSACARVLHEFEFVNSAARSTTRFGSWSWAFYDYFIKL